MQLTSKLLIALSIIGLAQAEDKKENDHEAVRIALSSLLIANKNGEWEKLFMIHSNDGQKIMLDEAFARLLIMAKNDIPASQAAKDVLRRYFDKDAAEKEINKSKAPLSRREQQIVLLGHISDPEKFYSEWRVIEEDYDERNVIRKLRNNVAKNSDFIIEINNDNATAKGKVHPNLNVKFIKEKNQWKVIEGRAIYINNE